MYRGITIKLLPPDIMAIGPPDRTHLKAGLSLLMHQPFDSPLRWIAKIRSNLAPREVGVA